MFADCRVGWHKPSAGSEKRRAWHVGEVLGIEGGVVVYENRQTILR